jgi:hypothetical protein
VATSCCGVALLQEGTRALHKIDGKTIMNIEATSQDISQEVKAWLPEEDMSGSSLTMTPSILPKLWQNGLRTKSRYWSGHQKALTSIL